MLIGVVLVLESYMHFLGGFQGQPSSTVETKYRSSS